ncbi:isopeptide-forming domain-containing fimbrial protein [Coraliomargarita sp. SDUM461004]|uniref:Isopeptide-forming domain-containing fimbrial protein n=1 Tax=Thalassobacterium sedimentorum TaxID=3041258 RepID=A0ABU1AGK7_9BACT|nr:isopeptide-forming domain-containing fimbrial protein [Coraliomargarita sp. SDUM461004]MDQ8193921.1 isopeptide-forming domain-containing fimbrial protein [Coraliomargarita sp. SDUM461004]
MFAQFIRRNFRRSSFIALSLLTAAGAVAADLTLEHTFTPADPTRDNYMDVGAVWDGSSQSNNGDVFTTTIYNAGATAYDLEFDVELPDGFSYVSGSVSAVSTTATATQSGTTLTVNLGTGGEFDLAQGESVELSYGLVADDYSTVVAGTYQLVYTYSARSDDDNTTEKTEVTTSLQNVLTQLGASILTLTPSTQTRGIGETAAWQATVTNTGFGGLFDVVIDLTDIYSNTSFINPSVTQSSPALSAIGSQIYVLPYLAPGEEFVLDLTAEVASCDGLGISVTNDELTEVNSSTKVAAIVLDLDLPMVDFTPPTIALDYLTASSASMTVTNTSSSGNAEDFSFQTNLNTLPVIISNVTGDFTYDEATGVFTLVNGADVTNSDALLGGESATLNFDIVAADSCSGAVGSVTWTSVYSNQCGDMYAIPIKSGSILASGARPSVDLQMDSSVNRVRVGAPGLFELELTADEVARIDSDLIVVQITASDNGRIVGFSDATDISPTVDPAADPAITTYTWTVDKAVAAGSVSLDVLYEIGEDPCLGGESFSISSSVSGVQSVVTASGDQCELSANAAQTVIIQNNPSPESELLFNVDGTGFETGEPSADTTRDIAAGEGEFIPIEVEYAFEDGYVGSWIGATYTDDFGGLDTQELVGGSLTVSFGSGDTLTTGPVAVPASAVTQSVGGLSIDLDFLALPAYLNEAAVSDTIIHFNYSTTVPYSELEGAASRGVTHVSVLSLDEPVGAVPSSACVEDLELTFTQVLAYTIERADAVLGISVPASLMECEVFDVTLTVNNRNDKNISNVLVTLNTPTTNFPYTYIVGQTPSYGGAFVGNVSYDENGGLNPTFTYDPSELTSSGTITVQFMRDPGTNVVPISATVAFDDRQTAPDDNRVFTSAASAGPSSVLAGELILNVTPNTEVQMNNGRVEWLITVQNVSAGAALNSVITNAIPAGLVVHEVDTNAANAAYAAPVNAVTISGSDAIFDLGDLASGAIRKIKVIAELETGSDCEIPDGTNVVTASWGCSTDLSQSVVGMGPNIRFGTGSLQVVHDTTESYAELCEEGVIRIKIKNTGDAELNEVLINEYLDELTTGLTIVPGSAFYWTDNEPAGTVNSIPDPSGSGTAGDPYVFTIKDGGLIPIAELVNAFDDDATTVNSLTIGFNISTTNPEQLSEPTAAPTIQASARADLFCGDFVNSPGVPFLIPIKRPDISTDLLVSNTDLSLAPAELTVGATGQDVVWSFEISNMGQAPAENVRVQVPLTASNSTATIAVNGSNIGSYDGSWIDINDIPAASGGSAGVVTVTVTETLGNICVNTYDNVAQVTWGCSSVIGNAPNVIDTPTLNFDTADVLMSPVFDPAQDGFTREFIRENDARGRVVVSMENTGAQALNFEILEDLPDNVALDETVAPVVTGTSDLVYDSVDLSDPTRPIFSFTGTVDYLDSFDFTFYVRSTIEDDARTASFPDLTDEEETANAYDPTISFPNEGLTIVEYTNSCGDEFDTSINADYDIRQPDLDINFAANDGAVDANVLNRVVFLDQPETFNIWVRNEGVGGSRATEAEVVITLGPAWTGATVTYDGNGGVSSAAPGGGTAYTFAPSVVGTFNTGANREKQFVVTATPTDVAGQDLGVKVDVDAVQILEDGSTEGVDLSTDTRAFRVIGVDVDKEFVSGTTSENLTADERDLVIGEEATFDLMVKFFGGDAGFDDIQNLVIRDSLGNSDAADRGLGLVSIDTTGTTIGATTTTSPSDPVQTEVIDFEASPGSITAANNTFQARIVTRVLNDTNLAAVNSDEKELFNNLGVAFDFYSAFYRSNNENDGFSGGTARPGLHDSETITVQRPTLSVEKTVRNVTESLTGSFAATASGEGTDVFQYKIVLTNTDSTAVDVPLFDLNLEDQISSKLQFIDGSGADAAYKAGADTDGDDSVDVFYTGTVIGGDLQVNASNLVLATLGENLVQLDPGESVAFHYFVRAQISVNPGESIQNTVIVKGDTLPGASGSQSGTLGSTGDDDGALELSAEDSAQITINSVSQSKVIKNTSDGSDDASSVHIGEQVEFEVSIVLPQGTAPDLQILDTLSEEFQLVDIGNVIYGGSVSATNVIPVTSPTAGALPVNGGSLDFTWSFGDTVVTAGSEAERSITVRYTTQIRNLDPETFKRGDTFKNSASYTFTGASEDTDIVDVTLIVAESNLLVTKVATPTEDLDAGDEVTYTVTLNNATGTAPAYDVNIVDTLPEGLSYKVGSTTVTDNSGLIGTLGEPDLDAALNELTWGREQSSSVNLDITAGGQLVFTYVATVDDSVQPNQELTNDLAVDWSSLDGDPGPDLGVAVGTAGANNGERLYSGDADATVTIANTSIQTTKTASGDTLPLDTTDDGFRVGDIVTYTIEVDVMEGTHEEFKILDTLPAGMAFVDFEAITPIGDGSADGFTYTALNAGTTAPLADATGELIFDLGTVVNVGDTDTDNDTLTLVYRARITDVAAVTVPDGDESTDDSELTLTNSVRLSFLDVDDETVITEPTTEDVVVKQPELIIEKDRLLPAAINKILEGETMRFQLTVTNTGDAPAYNMAVLDTLPVGMRTVPPVLISATLDGSDVKASLEATATYDSGSGEWELGELSDTQILEVDDTLVIVYEVVMDDPVDGGQTLTNLADVPVYYSKPSSDTDGRRTYDNVEPDEEVILTTILVSGTVFEDESFNRVIDPGEDWGEGETVYVNLVQDGVVLDSVVVNPGSGDYEFDRVSGGDYSIVVTDSPTNQNPVAPGVFIFYDAAPTDGRLLITAGPDDIFDQDFPLVTGAYISGVVFQDDGIGSGTPNDGVQNGAEAGIGKVTVRLTDGGSNVYDTVLTNGAGEFRLLVPESVPNGSTLVVEEYNLSSYLSTGGDAGSTGGSYNRVTDRISFVYTAGQSESDLAFGDIPANSFLTDGQQTIEPGAVAFYSHTFIAGTGGEVSFDIDSALNPALPGWGQTLFRDSNCNGQLDDGEPRLIHPSAAITVSAGEQICLIVKDSSPAGAPFGAQNLNTVTATFTYTNSAPALADDVLVRTDLTTIGIETTAGLELLKAVDKATASPGETITYTLTYTNNGAGALDDIIIYDSTPAYTTFALAPTPTYPLSLTNVVISAPNVGETGGIVWTFEGELEPGETGTVTYQVTVDDN